MIIGNGLIAKKCKSIDGEDVIIFASGVSNSSETDIREYDRETNLLLDQDKNKRLIYFSTCSIFDTNYTGEKYIQHKLNTETLIKNEFKKYSIFRLPNVVGKSNNKHTLFNYITNKIQNEEEIVTFRNCFRYLLDVKDLWWIIRNNLKNDIINVTLDDPIEVVYLIKRMAACLNKTANIRLENKNDKKYTVSTKLNKICGYNNSVIEKYYKG